jgi:glutathione S-transferase
MRLYVDANFASPYALVAFVSLLEKGLDFDMEPVDLVARAHWAPGFARTSITRRVPTLVHDDFTLSESSAICEYVDESFPGTRLYPTNVRERARARQIQAWLRSDLMPIRDERPTFVVFSGAKRPALSESARASVEALYAAASLWLERSGGNLFEEWSIADVDLAMMLQRLRALNDPMPPQLADYADRQWRRPTVQRWLEHPRPPLVGY